MICQINPSWNIWRIFYAFTRIIDQMLPDAQIELIWQDDEYSSTDTVVSGLDWLMCTAVYNLTEDTDLCMHLKDGSIILYDHLSPGQLQIDMPENMAKRVSEWFGTNNPKPPITLGCAGYRLPEGDNPLSGQQLKMFRIAQRNRWKLSIAYQNSTEGMKPVVSSWQLDTDLTPYLILFRIDNIDWLLIDVPNQKLYSNTLSSREAEQLLKDITNN